MEVTASHRQIAVTESSQPSEARMATREAAELAGFKEEDAYRAGIVATELATNLVKHARDGEMLIRLVRAGAAAEVEVIAVDHGPGMSDPQRSMADGFSTSGTPGTGLGAVRRLADAFELYTQHGRGTAVLARVRARRAAPSSCSSVMTGGVSIAKSGESVCGDGWQACDEPDGVLAVVADGLGHGLQAHEASRAAIASIDLRSRSDLSARLRTAHDGIRHTRGAAVGLAEILPERKLLKFAGIGNVAATIWQPGAVRHAVSQNGTLGHYLNHVREYSYPWASDSTMVMFSDGLASHWSLDDYPGLRQRHPTLIAAVLYRDFTRRRDDVTVVVARQPL
jgi:anti-sigma regulatory factor (Ser/Thr protein kinase)